MEGVEGFRIWHDSQVDLLRYPFYFHSIPTFRKTPRMINSKLVFIWYFPLLRRVIYRIVLLRYTIVEKFRTNISAYKCQYNYLSFNIFHLKY